MHFPIKLVGLICLIGVLMFFANSLRDEPIKASDNDSSKMKDDKRHSALLLAERDEREGRLDEDVSETDVD